MKLTLPRKKIASVRADLVESKDESMRARRMVVGFSLVSLASMAAVTLLQSGLVKDLPDPPVDGVDSRQVNLDDHAYQFGVPDGALGALGAAANLPLALWGGLERPSWMPLVLTLKTGLEALGSLYYFYLMPTKVKAWCPYCVAGALANLGAFGASLVETRA